MDVTMTKDGNMIDIDIKNVDENNFEKVWGIVNFEKVWGIVNETIDKNENATAEKEVDVKNITISGADTKLGIRNGVDDFAMQTIPGEDVTEKIERETYNTMTLIGLEANDNAKALYDIADRNIADDEMLLTPYKAVTKAAKIACEFMWRQSKEREATVTGEELADKMCIGIREFYNAWQGDASNPQPWKADDMEKDRGFCNVAYDFISTSEEYPVYTAIKMAASIACEYMCREMNNE